jgi:hypothetical protein
MSLTNVVGKATDLRQHADHCRRLASTVTDERTRSILRTMASEFDRQAAQEQNKQQDGFLAADLRATAASAKEKGRW